MSDVEVQPAVELELSQPTVAVPESDSAVLVVEQDPGLDELPEPELAHHADESQPNDAMELAVVL